MSRIATFLRVALADGKAKALREIETTEGIVESMGRDPQMDDDDRFELAQVYNSIKKAREGLW